MVLLVAGCYDGSVHGWTEPRRDAFGFMIGSAASSTPAPKRESGAGVDSLELTFAYKAHQSCLKCLAASCKNAAGKRQWLASGGTDEVVRVYDLDKLSEVGELIEHTDTVMALQFVGNRFLLSGGQDGKLCLWRTRDWNCVASLKGHKPGPVTGLAVHPSGKVALSTSKDNSLRMWNLETVRPASRNRISAHKRLELVSWTPMGDGYALVADSQHVLLFDVNDNSGKPAQTIKLATRVNALCFVQDSNDDSRVWLALGLENGNIKCYPMLPSTTVDDTVVLEFECGARVRSVAQYTGQDGHPGVAAGLSTGALQFWSLETKEQERKALQAGSGAHLTCMVADIQQPAQAKTVIKNKANKNKNAEMPANVNRKKRASSGEPASSSKKRKNKTTKTKELSLK